MKIRNGFVSNSSSSSFIIATQEPVTTEMVLGVFKTDSNSVLYSLAKSMAETIVGCCNEQTLKELAQDDYYDDSVIDQIKHYNIYYTGSISNEDGRIDDVLCEDVCLDYSDDTIFINKEAGF